MAVYYEVFRLADMWIIPDVIEALRIRLDTDRSVSSSSKLWFSIAYKFPKPSIKTYTERVLYAIERGNLGAREWDALGGAIMGTLSEATVKILQSRMTMARHVPPYHQPDKCYKGALCAFGWKEGWRRLYSKLLLRGTSGPDLYWRMDDHKKTLPDICDACFAYTLEQLNASKFFDEEEVIIGRAVEKLFKMNIPKVCTSVSLSAFY